jgi:hypothetical protein
MTTKSRSRVKTEFQMSEAVARALGKYAAREVRAGECIFDVVAFNKKDLSFTVVECKLSRRTTRIGQAFGQLAAYSATIATHVRLFLDAYSKKSPTPMHLERWMEATGDFRYVKVKFYVALTHSACRQIGLLRSMKKILPNVGIIRVKPNGECKRYLWDGKKKETELAQANAVKIKIVRHAKTNTRSDS